MKPFRLIPLLLLAVWALGCGAGHPKITSIVVSPTSANANIGSSQTVTFSATANFDDHTSRQLTAADGLTWKSSNTVVATIEDSNGRATCVTPGTSTITATAPADLVVTVNNGVSNTSPNVSGTATLNCM
ncbi:MAG TPA: hypothetical protein VFA89_12745 [Terriglobales bacterium]|nr:hypothetical protein [Terriglobales bacterium]